MKKFALVALGFVLGLFSAEFSSRLIEKGEHGEPMYGLIRRDVLFCEVQQSGCSDGKDWGGLMQGTPFRFRGDGVVDVRFHIPASSVKDVLGFRDKELAEKIKERLMFE